MCWTHSSSLWPLLKNVTGERALFTGQDAKRVTQALSSTQRSSKGPEKTQKLAQLLLEKIEQDSLDN